MKMKNKIIILIVNRWFKKGITIVLILIVNLSLTGCLTYYSATYDSPPLNLEEIKEGVDRKTVESILGKPAKKDFNVYTYEYNTQDLPPFWTAVFLDIYSVGTAGAVLYGDLKEAEKARKAKMRIVYGPKDTVINMNYDLAESKYIQWINNSNREAEIELLCISVNGGYAQAQVIQAMMHRYGLWGTEIDNVKAYLWLKLADFGGQKNVKEVMAVWAKDMTPDEIEEVEKSFRAWEPGSCEK